MLGDFPQNAWHVRGFPHKDVSVGVEEFDEHAFLFGGKRGANLEHLAIGVAGVHGDLLNAFSRLKGPSQPLGVRRLLSGPLPDGRELGGGDDCGSVLAALHLALVGTLDRSADGDDPS